jgi:glycerol-3-phosphate O-acyltransferase
VAFEVCHRINRATPVTPTALVTLALLGVEDRALTLGEVRSILDPLLDYVERRAFPTAGDADLRRAEDVRRTLDSLADAGVATCFAGGVEPVWAIGPDRHLEAAFYRNGAIHFFLNRAIAELVLARAAEGGPELREEAWGEALRLRDLLKFDFFFPRKRDFAVEVREEMAVFDPSWEQRPSRPEEAWEMLSAAPLHLAHRVLRPFLEAYLVVADRLAERAPGQPVEERDLLAECTGVGRQYGLQRRLHSPESVSRELFRNALRLADNRDLLDPGGEEVAQRRLAFAGEVGAEVRRVERVRDLALRDLARQGDEG